MAKAFGLRSVGPRVAMFDLHLGEHGLEGMIVGVLACGELGAVVREHLLEGHAIAALERAQNAHDLEGDGQGFLAQQPLPRPGANTNR